MNTTTTTRTLDPFSRIGTSYVLLYSAFETAPEVTRRDLILALDNVGASIGCPFVARDEVTLPADGLKAEFSRVIETIADVPENLHPLVTDDFEEMLAIYLPKECLKHALAHRLWEKDPKNYGRLMGFILSHLTGNGPACRRITEVIAEYAAAA